MAEIEVRSLARKACDCLIGQHHVLYVRRDGDSLPGFPLPIKKIAPDETGARWQHYRPLAILEYCNDFLSGEIAKREAREKKAAKAKEATEEQP